MRERCVHLIRFPLHSSIFSEGGGGGAPLVSPLLPNIAASAGCSFRASVSTQASDSAHTSKHAHHRANETEDARSVCYLRARLGSSHPRPPREVADQVVPDASEEKVASGDTPHRIVWCGEIIHALARELAFGTYLVARARLYLRTGCRFDLSEDLKKLDLDVLQVLL